MKDAPALIGLDVGTTGVKAVVFGPDGDIRGTGFREYGIVCDEPAMAEQDAAKVWRMTMEALRDAVGGSGIRKVRAIGLSVQGDAIIAVDAGFTPLSPAFLGMDYRPAAVAEECSRRFGSRKLFELTGMRPHPINSIVKAVWLKEHRPEIFQRAWKIVTYADFVLGKLGGEAVIDWTMASRTMAFDLQRRIWSSEVLESLGIDPNLLSRPEPSGVAVGALSADVAGAIGLEPGALLVTGGHDQTCAALGAGANREGIGVLSAGTADVLSTALRAPMVNDAMFAGYYPCTIHAKSDLYFTFALNRIGGILFRWYRDTLGGEEVRAARSAGLDPYDVMVGSIPDGPSPVMVLPHFNGSGNPMCDMGSRGAIVGLTLATTRGDIVKAILECLAFELRGNLAYWTAAGIDVQELRAVGGGAKSSRWLQIRADIMGRPVTTLKVREAACLGAAILAGTAAGVYSSLDEGIAATVRLGDIYEPDADRLRAYEARYAVYRDLYPSLKGVNARLV
jgi:xylulokinase